MDDFREHSPDAMFSKLLTNQENAEKNRAKEHQELRDAIHVLATETRAGFDKGTQRMDHHDTEIVSLNNWRENLRGRVAGITLIFGGLGAAVWTWITSLWHSGNPPAGH